MQYHELLLEPAEPMDEADREVSWTSGEDDCSLSSALIARTTALDARLIRVIKALDR